jgi:hypothetical protein
MKISEITDETIASHLRLEEEDPLIGAIRTAAVEYVRSYTGLSDEEMDEHEDLAIAVLIVASDMYDNRAATVKESNSNKTLECILGMHSKNQLPDPEA